MKQADLLQLTTNLFNALDILHDRLDSHVLAIRQEYNAHLPIHQLPVEVFANIIDRSVGRRGPRIDPLNNYGLVCRYWRDAIDSTPHLWSTVTAQDSPASVSKAILQSRACPLDVCLSGYSTIWGGPFGSRYVPNPSVPELCREVGRWRSIDLDICKGSLVHLEQLGPTGAHKLEVLRLAVDSHPNQLPMIDLFAGSADCLKRLHLRGIQIPWSSGLLLQVQDLELGDAWISGPQLGAVIQGNSRLCRLVVAGVTASNAPAHSPWPPASPVQHNSLQKIILGSKASNPATHLFPHLLFPNYEVLSVNLGRQPDTGALSSTAHATLAHLAGHLRSSSTTTLKLLWIVQRAELDAFACQATFTTNSCDLRLNIPMAYTCGSTWAQEVMKILATSGPRKLEIGVSFEWNHGRRGVRLDEDLVLYLGQLSGVRLLVCRSGLAPCLMDSMSRPLEGSGGLEWLFPDLEVFIYHDRDLKRWALDPILPMMQSRYGRSAHDIAVSDEQDSHPKPLEELQLPSWTQRLCCDTAMDIFGAVGLPPKFHDLRS